MPDTPERDRLWGLIEDEHARTVEAVLSIARAAELLDRHPAVQRTIRLRNPDVDPLNAIQVELLHAGATRRSTTSAARLRAGRWPAPSRASPRGCATR